MKYLNIVFLLTIIFFSCSDFLVEDISDEEINLRSPFNGAVSSESLTSFWWDTIPFADGYRLEVVHPSFDSTEFITVFIEQENNIYDVELDNGNYEWTVTAYNSAYEASSDTFSLSITADTIIDATPPTAPELESPVNESDIGVSSINLQWDAADDAVLNTLEVYSDSLLANEILNIGITSESYILDNLINSQYFWRVKSADDAGNESSYSEVWKFSIQ